MHPALTSIDGLLIDVDGTLQEDGVPIPGAIDAIESFRREGIPFRLLTNITRFSRADLAEFLRGMGFRADPAEIITATSGAARWLERNGIRRVRLLATPSARTEFSSFVLDQENPEVVLVGDLGRGWSYDVLNVALRDLVAGATLVAIQRNRYWMTGEGLVLDAGAFVAALEYATECEATVVGKPSRAFFDSATAELGLPPDRIAMIGDDLESDVEGAVRAGLKAIAVRTGKYQPGSEERLRAAGATIIDSVEKLKN